VTVLEAGETTKSFTGVGKAERTKWAMQLPEQVELTGAKQQRKPGRVVTHDAVTAGQADRVLHLDDGRFLPSTRTAGEEVR
jgi:hypothetical protein